MYKFVKNKKKKFTQITEQNFNTKGTNSVGKPQL